MIKVYVPRDSAARSMGADEVADALEVVAGNHGFEIIRNGSRGLLWLEPMVEVETASGRIAYGPVSAEDVPSLLAKDFVQGGDHRLQRPTIYTAHGHK